MSGSDTWVWHDLALSILRSGERKTWLGAVLLAARRMGVRP